MLFPIDYVSDPAIYSEMKKQVNSLFPYFDTQALDAARFFFGTADTDVEIYPGFMNLTDLLKVYSYDDVFDKDMPQAQFGDTTIPEGSRNATLSRFAGRVLKKYGDTDKARQSFIDEAAKCVPPLDDAELSTIWRSAKKFYSKVKTQPDYKDMETLQELIRRLRKAGAKSDATRGCGVHIHIGAKGHTPQSLRNLANIMASHESLLASALNLDRSRMSRYCRTVSKDFLVELNRKKPKTMAALADTWYGSQNADYGRSAHYNESRYHMLNLHATFTKGTIEFRLFQFDAPCGDKKNGLHAGQLKSYIQLCLALSQLAKQVKTASANPQQTENPKYAMRTWLLRLGFIGDEFKTARELYTKRLEGDTAFRNGRPQ